MRSRTKRGLSNILILAVTTICLVGVMAFCVVRTVVSQTHISEQEMEEYYREQEKVLLAETKEYLTELGFKNSGVTLTRVVDEEGAREYTFTIHHGKIDRMEERERLELAEELSKLAALEGDCSFSHEFLMYD